MADIKIGLMYSDLMDFVGPAEFGAQCETWGYESFWVADHALKTRLDPLTTLSAVAQATNRLRVGSAVMVLPYRGPYVTAKAAVTVDVLSKGRLMLGLGIGDLFHEFEALEIDRKVRGRLSDERLEIIRRLFTEEHVSFSGEFHQFEDVTLLPRAVQVPHIPIWLGGHWDQGFAPGVVKRTGRFADGFIPTYTPVEGYQSAQQAITAHAEAKGREAGCVEWGVMLWSYIGDDKDGRRKGIAAMQQRMGLSEIDLAQGTCIGSPAQCIQSIEDYAQIGITQFLLSVISPPQEMAGQYERLSREVLPHFS